MNSYLKFVSTAVLLCFLVGAADPTPDKTALQYGAKLTLNEPTPLAKALTRFEKEASEGPMLVSAEVRQVCQKKGCWMMLIDGDAAIRVTFTDYGFFVEDKIVGKKILAEGVFERKTLSQREVRHFMRDEGRSREEIRATKGSQETIQFVADGIQVVGA